MTVWKWSGESRYPGAFPPVLEKFCRAFSPGPTDCPWVSEDEKEFEQIGYKIQKIYVAGKCTRAHAPLARKYTNRILESQDGTTSIKYQIILKDTTFV